MQNASQKQKSVKEVQTNKTSFSQKDLEVLDKLIKEQQKKKMVIKNDVITAYTR